LKQLSLSIKRGYQSLSSDLLRTIAITNGIQARDPAYRSMSNLKVIDKKIMFTIMVIA
jgi:hypothetical protein